VFELHAFGFRANQAEVGKVVAFEQGGAEFQIQGVIMRHDDAVATRWQCLNLVDGLVGDDFFYALGDERRELLLPRVNPAHPAGQAGEQGHQCPGHMTCAKYGDVCLYLAHGFEQQHGHSSATLAQAGAQAEALQMGVLLAAAKHLAGNLHRLVFQMTAANGVECLVRADHHL